MTKVLLVEDDEMFGIVLNDQLEMNGYEVTLLREPLKAVGKLQEGDYDLVIMDKLLRGVDGTDICTQIRQSSGISETPVLMMSGLDGARQECLSAGANGFLAKPFEMKELLRSIEATIVKA